jgi:hypothetical protein
MIRPTSAQPPDHDTQPGKRHGGSMAYLEIDGLPVYLLEMGGCFHVELLVITRW